MNIQVISDIHIEFLKQHKINGFINSLDPDGVDVLVIAGDFGNLNDNYLKSLEKLCNKYKNIILVLGNHDYYHLHVKDVPNIIKRYQAILPENVHIFSEVGSCVIEGQNFICATGWYHHQDDNKLYEMMISDTTLIKGLYDNNWVYDQHELFKHYLNGHLVPNDIIVMHHLATKKSIHPKYKNNSLNRFFLCDIEDLIVERQPKLVIHGHGHDPFDYHIGKTRIVANPLGYYYEKKVNHFNNKLVIEV